jgi:GH15 family glucan-1,4-alpha-glucosidase
LIINEQNNCALRYALLRIGFKDEAKHFMEFLEARCREIDSECSSKSPLQVMYGINGEHELREHNLSHLRGYAG